MLQGVHVRTRRRSCPGTRRARTRAGPGRGPRWLRSPRQRSPPAAPAARAGRPPRAGPCASNQTPLIPALWRKLLQSSRPERSHGMAVRQVRCGEKTAPRVSQAYGMVRPVLACIAPHMPSIGNKREGHVQSTEGQGLPGMMEAQAERRSSSNTPLMPATRHTLGA